MIDGVPMAVEEESTPAVEVVPTAVEEAIAPVALPTGLCTAEMAPNAAPSL